MAAVTDALPALIGIVGADSAVQALVGGAPPNDRIFGLELPKSEASSMPRKALVIKMSGGPGREDYIEIGTVRYDFLHYGKTPFEARKLWRTVHPVMKQISRQLNSSVLIHSAIGSGGPISLRDGDTDWPFILSSWLVVASELTAA